MPHPTKILIQTTIPFTEDDWHVGRFSRLAQHLAALPDVEVTARDRAVAAGETDPVLGALDASDFDQLWLFAVDVGDGLNKEECGAIGRFRKAGGCLMITRDHMDLGSSVCTLGGVGDAHYFHSKHQDPDPTRRARDDEATTYIDWPNYHLRGQRRLPGGPVGGRPASAVRRRLAPALAPARGRRGRAAGASLGAGNRRGGEP